ncbi:MAG: bifunctional deaminase-reductase domain protein [Caulobacteraceae bacterium]|nr:bifunctional deaminase-reductase domain protein [Caulobacteraceae bacterium]
MRRLIVSEFVSLDGVMEAPGGEPGYPHTGWVIPTVGPEFMQYKAKETLDAESLLIGRITYESFAGSWPARDGPFADKMNTMRKDVVSTTLKDPEWDNSHVISADAPAAIAALKAGDGGPILVAGSGTLVRTLMEHDLVDEYRLMVVPVVLGSGRKLFPDSPRTWPLKLISSQAFSTGSVVNHFEPVRA